MIARASPRGQPVLVLGLLLGGWVALRVAFWETPFSKAVLELPKALLPGIEQVQKAVPLLADIAPAFDAGKSQVAQPAPADPLSPIVVDPVPLAPAIDLIDPFRPQLVPFNAPVQTQAPMPQRLAAAHNMLLLAGLSGLALPPDLAGLIVPKERPASAPYQPFTTFVASPHGGRWSADAWLLLRHDTATALTSGGASYGKSQGGAVLRFALAPSSPFRPMAYARISQALGGSAESELALGLSARPLPKMPLRAAAEVRVTQAGGQTLVRPAGYVVTELPPFELPLGVTAEAYGQAGYVGGRYSSAFADGQVHAERKLVEFGDTSVSAGGGAWGGAQKGAARLDIGPSASLKLKLGQTNSRVSMDWRFRVAGDAEPASGPALTISAGF